MSYDFNVAVHSENWPSSSALQQCINRLGYPVVLDMNNDKPLLITSSGSGLPVRFKNRRVTLDASIVRLSPKSFYAYRFNRPPDAKSNDGQVELYQIHPEEKLKGSDINEDLLTIGAKGIQFGYGDYVLTFSFHSSTDEIRAGLLIVAGMIKCFGGYGFEMQSLSHGADSFADELSTQAQDDAVWTKPGAH
jgi:hypothetical protein